MLSERPKALYLHVPFCPKICPYCDFHKMRRNEDLVAAYLNRLACEAKSLHQIYPNQLDTIYFGGGTPSHLTDDELVQVINIFKRTWGWPANLETTLEADPLTFDKKRLQTFKAMGFSRLSIGLQSTQDKILTFLGRQHDGKEGLQAITWALEAGFEVSADLITGISQQNTAQDLHALAQTGVPHISVYSLIIEPYTPFARRKIEVDEEKEAEDYDLTYGILKSYGLNRYEVSSHARAGHEAIHNQIYWHGDYFLALGPSAASFLPLKDNPGARYTNPPIKQWLQVVAPEKLVINAKDYLLDCLMTGLRTQKGVDLKKLYLRTQLDVLELFHPVIDDLVNHDLLYLEKYHLKASEKGIKRLNGILKRFFRFEP